MTNQPKSMGDVSKAIAELKPTELKLSDGTVVNVGYLSWMDFESTWEEIQEAVQAWIQSQVASSEAQRLKNLFTAASLGVEVDGKVPEPKDLAAMRPQIEKADEEDRELFAALTQHIVTAPRIVQNLVVRCTETDKDYWAKRPAAEMLKAATIALRVNYAAIKEQLVGFFAVLTSALEIQAAETKPDA